MTTTGSLTLQAGNTPGSQQTEIPVESESAVDVKNQYAKKIAYRSIGKGAPLILCNRFRGTLDTWDPAFLDALAKNYQVIIFDYSGFGLSVGTPATDMMSFAEDVRDISHALGFKQPIIGGWSFGGAVAQTFISQYPESASHGILIGTGPPGRNETPIDPIFFERSQIPENSFDDEVVLFFEPQWEPSRIAAKLSHERISKRTKDLDVIIPENLWIHNHKGFADFVEDKKGIRETIIACKVPLLVISGDHDISFPVENWYAMVRKLQTTHLIVIPMTGHGPHHEYPELVAQYIHDFVHYM